MPLFDYKCTNCESTLEILQKNSNELNITCDSCNSKMVKQVSSPSFRLKGTGWYETDFKNK